MEEILRQLLDEEATLQFERFDEESAWDLGNRLVAEAKARGLAIAIDIAMGGRRLFHSSRPGTSADNGHWIERKKRSVERFGHSSFYVGQLLKSRGKTLAENYHVSEEEFAAHGGCFPIIVRGTGMVGTVAVSGLPQEEDHKLVVGTIRAMLGPRD
jgi:uncharacterized protein (UPF0303 family)